MGAPASMDFAYSSDVEGTPGSSMPPCGVGGAATFSVYCDDKENMDPRFALPSRAARQTTAQPITPGAAAAAARDAGLAAVPGAYASHAVLLRRAARTARPAGSPEHTSQPAARPAGPAAEDPKAQDGAGERMCRRFCASVDFLRCCRRCAALSCVASRPRSGGAHTPRRVALANITQYIPVRGLLAFEVSGAVQRA